MMRKNPDGAYWKTLNQIELNMLNWYLEQADSVQEAAHLLGITPDFLRKRKLLLKKNDGPTRPRRKDGTVYWKTLCQGERDMIAWYLANARSVQQAATLLGIDRLYLVRRMDDLGFARPRKHPAKTFSFPKPRSKPETQPDNVIPLIQPQAEHGSPNGDA